MGYLCAFLTKMASEVGGFRTLRVKLKEECSSYHVLYYKKHVLREEESMRPSDRTLFIVNVPPYCNKSALKKLFGTSCGAIQSVFLMKQPGKVKKTKASLVNPNTEIKGFKVACVVFKKPSSLNAAMELDNTEVKCLSDDETTVLTGMEKWCQEYGLQYPNPVRLQKEVDRYMAKFDEEQEEAKRAEEEARGKPDEEGWITVGKGGRKPAASQIDATDLQEKKKKKKNQTQVDFYQFQQRESRREHIAQLRKKFEEDKKRIAEMKAARKFKPY